MSLVPVLPNPNPFAKFCKIAEKENTFLKTHRMESSTL
jgi:hypothetical protein